MPKAVNSPRSRPRSILRNAASVLCALPLVTAAQQRELSVIAHCHSVYLSPVSWVASGLPVTTFYTSYDGRNDRAPLIASTGLVSGEFRPDSPGSTFYVADYVIASSVWEQYGSVSTSVPTTDADGNGVLDFSQRDRAVDATLATTSIADWPVRSGPSKGTVRVQRRAGEVVGTYQTSGGALGTWLAPYAAGPAAFDDAARLLSATVDFTEPDGTIVRFALSTRVTRLSDDEIECGLFTARTAASSTSVFSQAPIRLVRRGLAYRGTLLLVDGNPATPWPDFTNWAFEIIDPNDSDHDGIPNLSDATSRPTAPLVSVRRTVAAVEITVSGVTATQPVTLWNSSDLRIWSAVPAPTIAGGGSSRSYTAPSDSSARFYRASIP